MSFNSVLKLTKFARFRDRTFRLICLLCLLSLSFFGYWILLYRSYNQLIGVPAGEILGKYVRIQPKDIEKLQIVYMRTKYFRREIIHNQNDSMLFRLPQNCANHYPNCVLSRNPAHEPIASAYLSHWRDFLWTNRELPPGSTRNSSKPSILLNFESPAQTRKLPSNVYFHLYANYREDSDIYIPYGQTVRLPVRKAEFESIDYWSNKSLPIAWMVSHCSTQSKRERYVKQLQKHIQVDIYGKCGSRKRKCRRGAFSNTHCLEVLSEQYYFYLSFENALYEDYLTEKIFELGNSRMIPVVYGGANYSRFLPPNSFIDATHYSPSQLAKVLHRIMGDKEEYNSYFRWKRDYFIISYSNFDPLYCRICEAIHDRSKVFVPKSGKAINDWYFKRPNKVITFD